MFRRMSARGEHAKLCLYPNDLGSDDKFDIIFDCSNKYQKHTAVAKGLSKCRKINGVVVVVHRNEVLYDNDRFKRFVDTLDGLGAAKKNYITYFELRIDGSGGLFGHYIKVLHEHLLVGKYQQFCLNGTMWCDTDSSDIIFAKMFVDAIGSVPDISLVLTSTTVVHEWVVLLNMMHNMKTLRIYKHSYVYKLSALNDNALGVMLSRCRQLGALDLALIVDSDTLQLISGAMENKNIDTIHIDNISDVRDVYGVVSTETTNVLQDVFVMLIQQRKLKHLHIRSAVSLRLLMKIVANTHIYSLNIAGLEGAWGYGDSCCELRCLSVESSSRSHCKSLLKALESNTYLCECKVIEGSNSYKHVLERNRAIRPQIIHKGLFDICIVLFAAGLDAYVCVWIFDMMQLWHQYADANMKVNYAIGFKKSYDKILESRT